VRQRAVAGIDLGVAIDHSPRRLAPVGRIC
jgi:hypothetical protein